MVTELPPISAVFLCKFDVHSGYDLHWYKTNNDHLYDLKGVEFSSLPSGLHSVSSDTIMFARQKGDMDGDDHVSKDKLLYGISIFHQNKLDDQKNGTTSVSVDRSCVKMYSLGVLIDPVHVSLLQDMSADSPWKPRVYSACWQYRKELSHFLDGFMLCSGSIAEKAYFSKFDAFFDKHKYRLAYEPEIGLEVSSHNAKINTPKMTFLTNQPDPSSPTISTDELTSIDMSIDASEYDTESHLVFGLETMLEVLGPLVYEIWKLSLLRKRILFYMVPENGSVVSIQEEQRTEKSLLKVQDMCKFIYSLSLISSIPKKLKRQLVKSDVKNMDEIEFNLPFYNFCINDIDFVKNISGGFLACTTDQILLEKRDLYDYCVRIPSNLGHGGAKPAIFSSQDASTSIHATHRDLEAFLLVKQFIEASTALGDVEMDTSRASFTSMSSLITPVVSSVGQKRASQTTDGDSYYVELAEKISLQEMIWQGISWWATAGESSKEIDEKYTLENALFQDLEEADATPDKIDIIISLIGYFQRKTDRLFVSLIELMLNEDSDAFNEHGVEGSSATVCIHPHDMLEMGLDPYSSTDCKLLQELVHVWWGRDADVGGVCARMCCF
ncbi:hypothetical protein HII13_004264 [Brettanomyces bruxellensis]|nr:hypothetical protein HII13_004264 [Brettanomyces bruxellensis]